MNSFERIVYLTAIILLLVARCRPQPEVARQVVVDTVRFEQVEPVSTSVVAQIEVRAPRKKEALSPTPPAANTLGRMPHQLKDSATVPAVDTLFSSSFEQDSATVVLPLREYIFTDSATYRARVQAAELRRFDIDLLRRTETIRVPERRLRLRPCIYAGYGITYSKGWHAGPQIGAGLTIYF